MKGNRFITGALVAVLATVAGCTLTISYDPRGVAVSLEGEWYVNGAPANGTSCVAAGIDTVQLVFWDGGVPYEYSEFRFNCEDGFFDTRPRGVLDHGRFQTQWLAYDSADREIAVGDMNPLNVEYPVDHAILLTPDFIVTGAPVFNPIGDVGILESSWLINGNPGDAAGCALAGFDQIQFVLYDQDDVGLTNGVAVAMAPCADGYYNSGTALLAAGSYLTSIVALDSAGTAVASYESPGAFVITTPGTYGLMEVNFEVTAPVNEMVITFAWSPGDTDCNSAGVDTIFWALNDAGTGSEVLSDAAATCASVGDQLTFSDLPAGNYELFVDAESADRLTKWQGTCDMLVHDGGSTAYPCFYDIMP